MLCDQAAKVFVDAFEVLAHNALLSLKVENNEKVSTKDSTSQEKKKDFKVKNKEDAIKFASSLSHSFINTKFRDGETLFRRSLKHRKICVDLQRALITTSLSMPTFTSQLAALKEIKLALELEFGAPQENFVGEGLVESFIADGVRWLEEH